MTRTVDPSNGRCRHDLVRAHCAPCREVVVASKTSARPGAKKLPSVRVRRLAAAVRAELQGRAGTKSQRKALRLEVERAAVGLSKADRKLAKELAMTPAERARAARAQRTQEDKLAGIYTPWITTQNVGRGRRS